MRYAPAVLAAILSFANAAATAAQPHAVKTGVGTRDEATIGIGQLLEARRVARKLTPVERAYLMGAIDGVRFHDGLSAGLAPMKLCIPPAAEPSLFPEQILAWIAEDALENAGLLSHDDIAAAATVPLVLMRRFPCPGP